MEVEVIKLGGSILHSREAFERAVKIVEREMNKGRLPVLVVSAMKGVTDKLISALDRSLNDCEYKPEEFMEQLLHEHIEAQPTDHSSVELKAECMKLLNVLLYIRSSQELGDSVYAYAVSRGENLSSRVLEAHLKSHGVKSRCFYGEDLIVTDDNCLEAAVEIEATRKRLQSLLVPVMGMRVVPVIAGFAGRSHHGKVTILGRGGTDDTAVNVAYGLGVKRAVKYVQEPGIMTVDPRFIKELHEAHPELLSQFKDLPEPRVVPYLSYVEASELLREERTKVVHYKVLDPLMEGRIEFQIRNYYDESSEGTIIGVVEEAFFNGSGPKPKAISYQRGLHGVQVLPSQSATPSEAYAKVFGRLAEAGVDIRYVSISGSQISFLLPEAEQARALETLRGLDVAVEVTPMKGRKGTFSVVGSEMRGMKGFFSRLTGVLARHGVNIEQATQPNSENIIRFGLDDADIPLAVAAVYNEFFR
ncbi:MAG: aspartate kinase [Candidatus Bathyarchaeota archaeon]